MMWLKYGITNGKKVYWKIRVLLIGRSLWLREYSLNFTQLSKCAPSKVADSRAKMSNFVLGVSEMVVKEFQTTMPINDMDISRFIVHENQID